MKKTLALVLSVVMIMGLALTGSAAAPLSTTDSFFYFAINAGTPYYTELDDVTITEVLNSSGTFQMQLATVTNTDGQALTLGTDYTVNFGVSDGGGYVNISKKDVDNGIMILTANNTTEKTKDVKVKVTLTPKGSGSLLSKSVSKIITLKVDPKAGTGNKLTLKIVTAPLSGYPLNATDKELSLDIGEGVNEFGSIEADVIKHLSSITDGKITAYKGSDYTLIFKAGNVGTANGLVDILGKVEVPSAVKDANSGVSSNLMIGINSLASNSAVATFEISGVSQDWKDKYGTDASTTFKVYDGNGKLTSYTAKYKEGDTDVLVFTAPVGNYVITGETLKAASTSGSGDKDNPNTGK